MFAGPHHDFIAAVEEHQRPVAGHVPHEIVVVAGGALREHAHRVGGMTERAGALEDVGEGAAVGVDRERLLLSSRHEHIEVAGIGRDAVHRTALAPELAADHAHGGAVVVDDFGDRLGLHVLIARRRHLQRRGEVGPQLEAVHPSLRIALRHFVVHDAATGGHPLHVAGAQHAAIAK